MLSLWTDVRILQSDITLEVPWHLSTGSKHDHLFCYCPLVGILYYRYWQFNMTSHCNFIWVVRVISVMLINLIYYLIITKCHLISVPRLLMSPVNRNLFAMHTPHYIAFHVCKQQYVTSKIIPRINYLFHGNQKLSQVYVLPIIHNILFKCAYYP